MYRCVSEVKSMAKALRHLKVDLVLKIDASEQSVFMCYMIVWSYLITFNFWPCTDPTYLGDSKHIIYLENASANMEFKLKVLGKQISISYQSNIPPRHNFILYFLSKHSPRTVQYINHFKNRSFYRFQWLYVNF